MDREQTLDLIYTANTLSEIKIAREARAAYLHEQSDDEEILEAGEMLSMLETSRPERTSPFCCFTTHNSDIAGQHPV